MCKCEKINTCEKYVFSNCVKYEDNLPEWSKYYNDCDIFVNEVIEELYENINKGEQNIYTNGVGLKLNNNEFSVLFGTEENTVMMGSWRPVWDDIIGKPDIPQAVTISSGSPNITVEGNYPNYIISATEGTGEENKINSIVIGSNQASIQNKIAYIPLANPSIAGVVKVGSGLSVSSDGTLSAPSSTYSAGSGINIIDKVINNSSPNATHTGDVTGSQSLTITNKAVSFNKIQDISSNILLGRKSAGDGVVEEIRIGSGLEINSNSELINTAGIVKLKNYEISSNTVITIDTVKTRVNLLETLHTVKILSGRYDSDELAISSCGNKESDRAVEITYKSKCGSINDYLTVMMGESYLFWWSETENIWLEI